MRNIRTVRILIALTLFTVALTGCKKDEEPMAPTPAPTTGTFKLGYGFHWGAADLDMNTFYTDGNGHAIKFRTVKFFLGQPVLFSGGSAVARWDSTYFLADAEVGEGNWLVGTVSPGSFDSLALTVGIDSVSNHKDPTLAEAPLNDATMHWNWNPAQGYVFLLLEGRVDDDGDGVVDGADPEFTYHCATDDARRALVLPLSTTVSAGGTMIPHLEIHMDVLCSNVDMLALPSGMGYPAVCAQLMDDLSAALSFE